MEPLYKRDDGMILCEKHITESADLNKVCCEHLTVVDPSQAFVCDRVHGIPATYVKPAADGTLPFGDGAFDLITCLGVLHHIPNVSRVLSELYRCLACGGYALLREPVISMGDWRLPRRGLTRRERGIPLPLFRRLLRETGFELASERLCLFPPIPRLWRGQCSPSTPSKRSVLRA